MPASREDCWNHHLSTKHCSSRSLSLAEEEDEADGAFELDDHEARLQLLSHGRKVLEDGGKV